MTDTQTRDPDQIEQDIRHTQDAMSATVDKIGNQLTGRNILNALLDNAESRNIDADMIIDGVRRNPLAIGMIAGGAIWLLSASDARPSTLSAALPKRAPKPSKPKRDDFASHMGAVEWREGEDPEAYRRRRDSARATYFMTEQRHDEDEGGFRRRLDEMTDMIREKRHDLGAQGSKAMASLGKTGSTSLDWTQHAFTANPLIGGLAAAAVGAIFGSALPLTQTEQAKLSGLGGKARDLADEQKDKLTEVVRDKKDELVEKVEQSAQSSGVGDGSQNPGQPASQPAFFGSGEGSSEATAQSRREPSAAMLTGLD